MFKKKFGQNFLINDTLIDQIIELENIQNKNILEIGPGNLALTKKIIQKKPKNFFALEIDNDLVIKHQNSEHAQHIINKDALKIDEYKLFNKKKFSIISNLPFNISAQLLIKWLKIQNKYNCIENMILMFQKELAERIVADINTKKYGRISILSSAFFKIEKKLEIGKKNFYPIPNVDTVVLKFTALKKNKIKDKNFHKLEKITQIFFNERRKINTKKINKIFTQDQINKWKLYNYFKKRPENLSRDTYYFFASIL